MPCLMKFLILGNCLLELTINRRCYEKLLVGHFHDEYDEKPNKVTYAGSNSLIKSNFSLIRFVLSIIIFNNNKKRASARQIQKTTKKTSFSALCLFLCPLLFTVYHPIKNSS